MKRCGNYPCSMSPEVWILLNLGARNSATHKLVFSAPLKIFMDRDFDSYLRAFDYDERLAVKIGLEEILNLYIKGKIQLIDIRFYEEHAAWSVGIGQHIPLSEIPDRLDELDRDKTTITMCPHYDRAEIARLYLTLKGYHARYLTAGMLKLVDYLRGDKARDYMARL